MTPRLARIVMTAGLLTALVAAPAHATSSQFGAAHVARDCAGANRIPTGTTLGRAASYVTQLGWRA